MLTTLCIPPCHTPQDKPPLPAFPKYEGLGFASTALPSTRPDVAFPPMEGLVSGIVAAPEGAVPIPGVPRFSVTRGMEASA